MLRWPPSRHPARRVALRDADGVHGVEATPLSRIGPRLRWATVGDTTFGSFAEGSRRQGGKNIEADIESEHRRFPPSLVFEWEDEDARGPREHTQKISAFACLRIRRRRFTRTGRRERHGGVSNGPHSPLMSSGRKPKTSEDRTMRESARSKRQATWSSSRRPKRII